MKHLKSIMTAAVIAALFVSAPMLHSCKSGSVGTAITTDSIKASYDSDSLATASLIVDYPTGVTGIAADSVRAFINHALSGSFYAEEYGVRSKDAKLYTGDLTDGKAVIGFYGKAYEAEVKKMRQEGMRAGSEAPYIHLLTLRKTADTDFFCTYVLHNYWYTAGAHGSDFVEGTTIAKTDGHTVGYPVDTLKKKDMQPLLRRGLISYFNNDHQQGETVTEKNLMGYLFVEDGVIPLPAVRPYFSATGITFVYQQYEIGAYAMGQPTFTIPYSEIAPFATKDALTLISPMLEAESKKKDK